jgi:hypothetical protein
MMKGLSAAQRTVDNDRHLQCEALRVVQFHSTRKFPQTPPQFRLVRNGSSGQLRGTVSRHGASRRRGSIARKDSVS